MHKNGDDKTMRKTKIVCTIGPASESPEMLEKLIEAGMNVARLNFSHGNHEEHANRIAAIRDAAERMKNRLEFYWTQKDLKSEHTQWKTVSCI